MKKNYNLSFTKIFFTLFLTLLSLEVWGQTYNQITTLSELTSGDYLLAGDGATSDGLMLNTVTVATPYINSTTVTNPGTTISAGYSANNVFQITVSGGTITIYNSSVGYVSWGRTGNIGNTATFFNGTIANTEQWTPTVSSGLWSLANVNTNTRLLQWNTASPRFACYTGSQTNLKLYKLAGKTVTFNNNGGSGTMANQIASTATNLTANTFTRANYNFANWHTTASGTGGTSYANNASYPFTADATLYAQWQGNVTYNANGGTGTVTDSNTYSPGASVSTLANGFTYAGFAFTGWNTQADGAGTDYAASTANAFNFIGNTTLYAKWSSSYSISFANLQFPGAQTINEGSTFDIYGQVYAAGLTEAAGAGAGIVAEVGYSSSNTNPNIAGWTWISAGFNSQVGNNDEYKGTLGSGILNGTYYYATRYKIGSGGTWVYGGYNSNTPTAGGIWNGTANVSGMLTVNSNTVGYANIQSPFTGNIVQGGVFNVYGQVYKSGYTEAAGANPSISAWIGYSNTNATTTSDFSTGWTWVPAAYNVQSGNNDEYVANIGTSLSAGTYYYVSRFQVAGSTEYKYGGTNNNFWGASANSGVLNVFTAPAITSSLTKSSVYGASDSYAITATGTSPITYNATGLPAGLTVNTTTGLISGAATADVGNYNVSISAANGGGTDTKTLVWTITQKPLTITGLAALSKIYDGSTAATLSGTPALNTIVSGDDVNVSGTPTVTFATKTVGTAKPVSVTGFILSGAKAGNYTLSQPTGLTANITAKVLTVSGATAQNKVYDNTVSATITGAALLGVISPDVVAVSGGGTFADSNAGLAKTVTATLSIGGVDAANYTLTQPAGLSADITKANPVITASTINVTVGGNYVLPGAVTSTSPGILSYSMTDNAAATLTGGNTLNGIAVGTNTLTVNQAASANYNAASTTVLVNVSTIFYGDGDYRSINDGNWHGTAASGSVNTWQKLVGGVWTAVTNSPPSSAATLGTNKVYINNNISLVGTNTAPYVVVLADGELHSNVTVTFGNLLVKSGGEFYRENNATGINSSGVFEVEDGGNAYITQTNTTLPSIWAGTEKFHPNSNIIIKRLDAGAVITDNSSFTPFVDSNGNSAYFGNLIIDSSVDIAVLDGTTAVAANSNWITNGDLILRSGTTATSAFRFVNGTGTTSTTALPYTIGGNFIVESGFTGSSTLRNSSVTTNLKVKKDFIMSGASIFRMTGAIITTGVNLYIDGNVKLNDTSSFLFSSAVNNSSPLLSLYLKGDIAVASGATFSNLNTAVNNANFYFTGNGDGTSDALTQTIDIAPTNGNAKINFSLIWPAFPSVPYVKLVKDLYVGTNSTINVRTNATLDFGFNGNTALNILRVGSSSGQAFNAASSSVLKITSPEGLSNGTSVYTGNVQIGSAATARIFDQGAVYHYIGKSNAAQVALNGADQVTGNGLPSQITGKVIAELETQNTTQDDLILRSSGTTTFGTTGGVNGILEIRKGKVIDEPGSGFRNYNGALDDGETDTQRGDLKMTGGRYVVSGAGTKPALSGIYTLTAGTVEFTGTAATKIRTSTPAKQYFNVDVSGINVETAGKNLVVNNLLKVTTPTAVLTVPEILDDAATPYVVTAKKGIQVTSGGKAIFKNNANLIQDIDAANTGNITMERKANVPTVQYNYWASPVKNQALYSLYPGIAKDRVMVYNSSTDKFTILTTASNPLSVFGKGYSIKGSSDAAYQPQLTATFVGEPNNETSTGTNTIPLSAAGNNYNLIGNPYPSNLDLLALYGDADNTSKFYSGADEMPTAYFWDNTSNTDLNQVGSAYATYSQNNYALLNLSSGTGTPAPRIGAVKQPNGIVKPGQGFIVRAAETAGNLTFKNSFRTTAVKKGTVDGVYYRSEPESTDRYWLKLTTPTNMNIVIAVGYYASADNTFERFDSTVFSEAASENLYSLSSDAKKLAIQGRKGLFTTEDVVPLGVKTFTPGTQQISLEGKEGSFENQTVYLKDKVLNTITNLSQGSYVFSSVKGIEDNRFEIIYKDNLVLGTDSSQQSEFVVYRDGKSYVIKSSKSLGKIELYDLSGRMILTNNAQGKSFTIDSESLPNGVFIIKVENSGDVKTKKIIK